LSFSSSSLPHSLLSSPPPRPNPPSPPSPYTTLFRSRHCGHEGGRRAFAARRPRREHTGSGLALLSPAGDGDRGGRSAVVPTTDSGLCPDVPQSATRS